MSIGILASQDGARQNREMTPNAMGSSIKVQCLH
jgi:hypothetical protein